MFMAVSKQNIGCCASFRRSSSASWPWPEVCAVLRVAMACACAFSVHANSCSQTCRPKHQQNHTAMNC